MSFSQQTSFRSMLRLFFFCLSLESSYFPLSICVMLYAVFRFFVVQKSICKASNAQLSELCSECYVVSVNAPVRNLPPVSVLGHSLQISCCSESYLCARACVCVCVLLFVRACVCFGSIVRFPPIFLSPI